MEREEVEAKLTTAKSIEFKWREEWNYQCKHQKKLKQSTNFSNHQKVHTYHPTSTHTKEADHTMTDYKKEKIEDITSNMMTELTSNSSVLIIDVKYVNIE